VEESGKAHFLDNLFLTITQDGKVLYTGRLRGDGVSTPSYKGNGVDFAKNALNLGKFKNGVTSVLTAEVRVDSAALVNADWVGKSTAKVKWGFSAIKDTPQEVKPPKTGEVLRYTAYIILLMLLIAIIMLMYVRSKFKNELSRRQSTLWYADAIARYSKLSGSGRG
jgi:hypothetical protein